MHNTVTKKTERLEIEDKKLLDDTQVDRYKKDEMLNILPIKDQ